MRYLIPFLFFITPASAFAQTKTEVQVINKFMRFYNDNQANNLCSLFIDTVSAHKSLIWPQESLDSVIKQYGRIKSFKYIGWGVRDGPQTSTSFSVYHFVFADLTLKATIVFGKGNKFKSWKFEKLSEFEENVRKKHKKLN